MAESDKITTTSSMQDRSHTQETPQQVRTREARAEAAARHIPEPQMDVAAVVGTIEELLDNVGKESLHLESSDELAGFLNHVNMAKSALQQIAQMERDKAMAAEVEDE